MEPCTASIVAFSACGGEFKPSGAGLLGKLTNPRHLVWIVSPDPDAGLARGFCTTQCVRNGLLQLWVSRQFIAQRSINDDYPTFPGGQFVGDKGSARLRLSIAKIEVC